MGEVLGNQIPEITAVTVAEWTDRLEEVLPSAAIPCDAGTARGLSVYHRLLTQWNSFMNLTGDTDFELSITRHYLDSLMPLRLDGLFPKGATLIDVGTGAGFPGLPLAIARPDMKVTLMDALSKRLKFLAAVVEELGLDNVQLVHARAEDGGKNPLYREKFDISLARGVAAMPVLSELLIPFAKQGGKVLCYKGPAAGEEWSAGEKAARILGGGRFLRHEVEIHGQPEWEHCIIEIPKVSPTPAQYPRKAGTPEKKPLGFSANC